VTKNTFIAIAAVLFLACGAAFAQSNPSPSQAQVFPMPPPDPATMTTPGGRDVPARITTDRHTRCMQYGASIGVPPDRMEDYVKRCALQ
jgi:hypothetical protein